MTSVFWSILIAAILEIFNVKEWPDLEKWVWESFKVIEKCAVR